MEKTAKIETPSYIWESIPKWEDYLRKSATDAIEKGEDPPGSTEVKTNVGRRVLHIPADNTGGPALYLKRFSLQNFWHALKYSFVKTKARRERDNIEAFADAGISVPRLAFIGEPKGFLTRRPNYLALEAIEDFRYPNEILLDGKIDNRRFLAEFARWSRGIFRKGAVLHDFHPGNVLVQPDGDGWRFNLIDLHDAALGKMTRAQEIKSLSKLMYEISEWMPPRLRNYFLDGYGAGDETNAVVESTIEKWKAAELHKRMKRSLVKSSGYSVHRLGGWKIIRRLSEPVRQKLFGLAVRKTTRNQRPDVQPEQILGLVRRAGNADRFKGDVSGIPVRVERAPGGRTEWGLMAVLRKIGVAVPEQIALAEKGMPGFVTDRRIVVRDYPDSAGLKEFLEETESPAGKDDVLKQATEIISRMHSSRVAGPASEDSFIVVENDGGRCVFYTAADSATLADGISVDDVSRALSELFKSLDGVLGDRERLKFAARCFRDSPFHDKRKKILENVD